LKRFLKVFHPDEFSYYTGYQRLTFLQKHIILYKHAETTGSDHNPINSDHNPINIVKRLKMSNSIHGTVKQSETDKSICFQALSIFRSPVLYTLFFSIFAALFFSMWPIFTKPVQACSDMDIVNIVKSWKPETTSRNTEPQNNAVTKAVHIAATPEAAPIVQRIMDRLQKNNRTADLIVIPSSDISDHLSSKKNIKPDIFFYYGRKFSQRSGLCPKFYPFFIELALDSVCLLFSKDIDTTTAVEAARIADKDWPVLLKEKVLKFGKMDKEYSSLGIRTENMAKMAALKYKKVFKTPEAFLKIWNSHFNFSTDTGKTNIFRDYRKMISALERDEIDLCFSYYASACADSFRPVELPKDINQSRFFSWQKSSMAAVKVAGKKEIAQAATLCMTISEPDKKSSQVHSFLMDFFKQASAIFDSVGLRTAHIVEDTKYLLYINSKDTE
jgi:hypothetical protein